MGLILVGGLAGAARVDAASLTLEWAAPTTNADGTRLTDLGSYRIYLGTSSPACPSASFFTVASPTSSPASGQTLSRVVSSLSAGTTYFARVTAVDTSGNESTCSATASGVAKADFSVTPSTTTSFGSVAVGTTVDRIFTVQNTSTTSFSGTASIGAPYSIQTGGSFSLAAGASQTVTVRFRPTSSGTFAANVNFVAAGDTISRAVTGSGTGSSTSSTPATYTLSVTKNGSGSGMVTGLGINCGADCSESVTRDTVLTLTAAPAAGSTFAGWSGACSGTGSCALTVTAATTVTATFNLAAAATSTAPGAPGNPSVTRLSTDTIGATFAFAWAAGSGATSYAYTVAFSDGSWSQQSTVTTSSFQLRIPYHASGAAVAGYICVKSVNAAGQSGLSCNSVPVPARGATPLPVTLSVTKTGSGSGTVTSTPSGISCGTTCSQSVTLGTALTLTATPASGSTFGGWTGACSGTASCALTVSAATTVTATFNVAAPSTPPGAPGNPSVTQLSLDSSGVLFAFAWTPGSGAVSYAYTVAFNDGSGTQRGTVTALSLQLRLPYHASGAAFGGYICVQSVNAAGQTSGLSCNALTVPKR